MNRKGKSSRISKLTEVKRPIKLKLTLSGTANITDLEPSVEFLPHWGKRRASNMEPSSERNEADSTQGTMRYQ